MLTGHTSSLVALWRGHLCRTCSVVCSVGKVNMNYLRMSSSCFIFLLFPQEISAYQTVLRRMLDGWRSTVAVPGTLCVTMVSTSRKHKLCVVSLDTKGEMLSVQSLMMTGSITLDLQCSFLYMLMLHILLLKSYATICK